MIGSYSRALDGVNYNEKWTEIVSKSLSKPGFPLKDGDGGMRGPTLFRIHLSNALFALGSLFQICCPLKAPFFTFLSMLGHNVFIHPLQDY